MKLLALAKNMGDALISSPPLLKAAILQGNQPKGLKLSELMREMPLLWEAQEKLFGFKKPSADCSK